jgi:peroxiredoxin (alkyl hydroperoxide reductase subunit C)
MKRSMILVATVVLVIVQMHAQDVNIPQIGAKAPAFSSESTNGKINFPSDLGDSWKILFSHPKDFTPVCSSEILELAYAQESFDKLNTKLVVISTDIMEQHKSWKKALEEISYKGRDPVKINFPFVADNDLQVARSYGMIHSESSVSENIRGVYFIDPDNNIRAIHFYPNEVGRSIEETQRMLIALQSNYSQKNRLSPANWRPGDDLIVPVVSEHEKKSIGKADSKLYQFSWFMVFEKSL